MGVLDVIEIENDSTKGILEVSLDTVKSSYRNLRIDIDFCSAYNIKISVPKHWFNNPEEYLEFARDSGMLKVIYDNLKHKLELAVEEFKEEVTRFGGTRKYIDTFITEEFARTRQIHDYVTPIKSRNILATFEFITLYYLVEDMEYLAVCDNYTGAANHLVSDIGCYDGMYWLVRHFIDPNMCALVSAEGNLTPDRLATFGVELITLEFEPMLLSDCAKDFKIWYDKDDLIRLLDNICEVYNGQANCN